MVVSTSGGRAFKEVVNDPAFSRIGKNAKSKVCIIVDKLLTNYANSLKTEIDKKHWDGVYGDLTTLRRFIEFWEETCK